MRDNITAMGRGETWFEGATPSAADIADDSFLDYCGETKVFEDYNWNDRGIKSCRLGKRQVVCRLVRNTSGITLYGKRLVRLDMTNPNKVSGYAENTGLECYPTDEFLPATGVPNGDLFWIVIKGPAVVLTGMNGADFGTTSFTAGQVLGGLTTSGTSTATGTTASAGRLSGFIVTAATMTTTTQQLDLLNFATNWVGKAISAMTSGQTNADCLIDVRRDKAGWP